MYRTDAFAPIQSTTVVDDRTISVELNDNADRHEANARVQERLAAQMPYVWLWDRPFHAATAAGVRGLDTDPIPGGGTRVPIMVRRLNFEAAWLDR